MPAPAQAAFEHAADIWAGILVSDVPIKVQAIWFPMGGATLGITFPNARRDFAGAPLAATWYATSLANSIAGVELNPGEEDINIYFDSGSNWYLDLTGTPAPGQYDFVSVALHELGHGLGFVGVAKKDGSIGSFGLLQQSDFAPLVTSFPWPQLDTLPGIFDRFLSHQLDGPLIMMPNPGTQLGSSFTSNNIYFNGANAMAANGGNAPRIYAPSTFALGSSCVHLNESTYPPGNPNELMTPFISPAIVNHWPGPLCLAMLLDIGWLIAPDAGIGDGVTLSYFTLYPNPASDLIQLVSGERIENGSLFVLDVSGRVVMHTGDQHQLDISSLEAGQYNIIRHDGEKRSRAHFVKQ